MSSKKGRRSSSNTINPSSQPTDTTKEPKTKIKQSDLINIYPKTNMQNNFFNAFGDGNAFLLLGVPGTGKTFISLYKAFQEILEGRAPRRTITLIRSIVPTRDIGYLPGDEKEKAESYTRPYLEMSSALFPRFKDQAFARLREQKLFEFMTTSFIRGLTLDDRIVIIDEAQNMTLHELHSVITRLGENSKIIICGDSQQTDLHKKTDTSGLASFVEIIKQMPSFQTFNFGIDDIVRGTLVREYIIARLKAEGLLTG